MRGSAPASTTRNQSTLDRIAAGEMPFLETGAEDLLRNILPTGRLEFGHQAR